MVQTKRSDSNGTGNGDGTNLNTDNLSQMDKGLKIGHALLALLGFMLTVVTLIVNQSNKIETQRLRIEFLETVSRDHGIQIRDLTGLINTNYVQMKTDVSDVKAELKEIRVMLQTKEDRYKK